MEERSYGGPPYLVKNNCIVEDEQTEYRDSSEQMMTVPPQEQGAQKHQRELAEHEQRRVVTEQRCHEGIGFICRTNTHPQNGEQSVQNIENNNTEEQYLELIDHTLGSCQWHPRYLMA